MKNIKVKRICAYFIDIFIVSMLATGIGMINFFNPHQEEYQKTVEEVYEYTESIANTSVSTEDLINEEYAGLVYNINYYSLSQTVITILVITLYFTLFPRFNNDQTIGKQLLKIKVVCEDRKRVPLYIYLIKALMMPVFANIILFNVVGNIINVVMLFSFKGIEYLYANTIVTNIFNLFCYADILKTISSKEGKSLRDVITKTRVVEMC